jgi:hypothetical protein
MFSILVFFVVTSCGLEVNINVSEENIASILRAEVEQRKKEVPVWYTGIYRHISCTV